MFRRRCSGCLILRVFFHSLAACAMLSSPLFGQARPQGQNDRPRGGGSRGFDALPAILRIIQDRPPASLVILDIREAGWESQVGGLLQQDPLVVLNLNLVGLSAVSGAGLELVQRESWAVGAPRWCLMSADGKVLYSSEKAPTPDLIMGAFKDAGLSSRLDILRQFLVLHQDHAEARLALLGELRAVAEARTRAALGVSRQAGGGRTAAVGTSGSVAAPLPQELDFGVDSDIWGEYAKEADYAFQLELWKQDTNQLWGGGPARGFGGVVGGIGVGTGSLNGLFRGGGTSMVSNLAQYSPTMKRIYQRWLPDIEYALSRRPSSYRLWDFWLVVQRAAGGRDLGAFQASLVPGPDDSPRDIPPSFIRTQWIQDCVNRGDWRMAEDVARGAWENLLSQANSNNSTNSTNSPGRQGQRPGPGGGPGGGGWSGGGFDASMFNARTWNSEAEPYIEVLLRQQKTAAADAVLQQWLSQGGWIGAAQRASSLANRIGLTDIGSRWGALAPASIGRR